MEVKVQLVNEKSIIIHFFLFYWSCFIGGLLFVENDNPIKENSVYDSHYFRGVKIFY